MKIFQKPSLIDLNFLTFPEEFTHLEFPEFRYVFERYY